MSSEKIAPLPNFHLPYLDGIRGSMAVYVLLFHWQMLLSMKIAKDWCPVFLNPLIACLQFGRYAVAVFIVLSGYCLMLPIERSQDRNFNGGVVKFLIRRIRRIFPAYYGALFIYSGVILICRLFNIQFDFLSELNITYFLARFFLVQNLNQEWMMKINHPMWSLAIEWQIYFIFALMLIPIYRKFGIYSCLIFAFILSCLPHFILPRAYNLDWASPSYLFLFSLGMFVAKITSVGFSEGVLSSNKIFLTCMSLICLVISLFFDLFVKGRYEKISDLMTGAVSDLGCGFGTVFFLLLCRCMNASKDKSILIRFLESKVMLFFGAFSYSIYLFHQNMLDMILQVNRHFGISPTLNAFLTFACIPIILALCYGCYLLFEKPFLSTRKHAPPNS